MTKILGNFGYRVQRGNMSNEPVPSVPDLSEELSGTTNVDRVIDDFKQGQKTGNCYFLVQLKNLRRKSWGKKMIKDAIQPDNKGGAYV